MTPGELYLYIVSDEGYLSPIYDSRYDETTGSLFALIIHFSSGMAEERPSSMSSLDIQRIAEALGFGITPEYLPMLNEVFDLYVGAIYNPWLDTSLIAGVQAVEGWYNTENELSLGSG